ncbi:MAG: thiamine phosphate synthase [Thermoanaerobaculia bacterium]|nr:thiamine phosphate synthase [Thermoanaerobaculia bacterium]
MAISSESMQMDWLDGLIDDGVDYVQIRLKHLADGELFRQVWQVVERSEGRIQVLVNGRADIARAAGADGVHLPARGVPTHAIRARFPELLVGRSTHCDREISTAARDGADYVTFSPILPTLSKARYGPPQGLTGLRSAVGCAGDLPVVALGGLDAKDVADCVETGARGVAGIRVFQDRTTRRCLVQAWEEARS